VSDIPISLHEAQMEIVKLRNRVEVMTGALAEVERWWLEDQMHKELGAPNAIFQVRAALTACRPTGAA
jgi:hypothetical protein